MTDNPYKSLRVDPDYAQLHSLRLRRVAETSSPHRRVPAKSWTSAVQIDPSGQHVIWTARHVQRAEAMADSAVAIEAAAKAALGSSSVTYHVNMLRRDIGNTQTKSENIELLYADVRL